MNNELRLENAFLPKDTLLPDSLQDNGQHLDDYIVVTFQSHHGFPHTPPPNKHNISNFYYNPTVNKTRIVVLSRQLWVSVRKKKATMRKIFLSAQT